MKKFILLWTCFLISMGFAFAQNKQVSGTIIDDKGEPVIGASVIAKGEATIGTVTDMNGKFTLDVPASTTTLVVKYLGMQEQEVAASSNMSITMQPTTSSLDEVIVVAYGTAKKSAFTGSAATIKSEQLANRSVSNVTNALSGQTAGVQVANMNGGQPGTAATIRVRGFGSISASSAPLYIIDGSPFDGNMSAINTADIESITVLKDAAANAIYGARGANGVVLITTKKGNTREAKVTVDAKWGSNSRAVPSYALMTSPAQYYETLYKALYNSKVYNGGTAADGYAYADATLYAGSGGAKYLVYTVPEGQKLIGSNFKLNPNATLGYYDGEYYYYPDNWYNETFKHSNMRQEYNVSISGSTDKLNYYISGGYLNDKGIIPSSGFTRYTGLIKEDYQAKKWLKVGANLALTNYNMQQPPSQTSWGSSGNLFYNTNEIAPIYPMYMRGLDANGNPYIMKDEQGRIMYDYGNTTNFTRAYDVMSNPLGSLALDSYNQIMDAMISKWYAILTPVEGLTLTANLGANLLNRRYSYLYNPFHGSAAGSNGEVVVEHDRDAEINQQYLANYTKTFNNSHNFSLLAGFESYVWTMQQLGGDRQNLYDPWVGELSNGIQWPPSDMYSSTDKYATQGFLSRLQYDYKEKYFASASYRRDGSSRFYRDNRWGNFGSGGLAWLISKEGFFTPIKEKVNTLKLKISYGVQGNDNLSTTNYYNYADQFQIQNDGTNGFAIVPTAKGNKDLTWETSYTWNGGAEFELFDSRLNGSVEYFYRTTKNLLYAKPLPVSSGFRTMPINALDMVNNGYEIDLTGTIIKNRNITWDVFANLTWFRNMITNVPVSANPTQEIKTNTYIMKKGASIYNGYMVEYAGVDKTTGKQLFYVDPDNGDMTTTDDWNKAKQANIGPTFYAPYYGGFGTSLKAYGFDLSLQFAYQFGGKTYDDTYQEMMHSGQSQMSGYNWHKDILNSWTPDNTDTNIPRLASSDDTRQQISTRFLISNKFLNLNSASVGYTFSEKWLKKADISALRLFVSGDNLLFFSARQGFDPRLNLGIGGPASDYSAGASYSLLRTISGGISLTF